jgi:PAS domain S-box-containing protein
MRRAQLHYRIRASAFAYTFGVLALHGYELARGPIFWTLLALQFLVYPHLAYLRARHSADSRATEYNNLHFDAATIGAWVASLQFPLWIAYAGIFSTAMNGMVVRGAVGAMWSLGLFGAGAALWIAGGGMGFNAPTSDAVTALCFAGSLGYTCMVGYSVFMQNRRLAAARDELRSSEERYRMIAENAGDLIAMVDQAGRWLYASPSYERMLKAADLEPGADALRQAHPDDAEQVRVALLRVAATGKAREVALRLVDREGRVRSLRTQVQAVGAERPAARLLLVSQDVTDLRESEERLLVAAHALEGMTEAIMITSGEGTIATVNRAFCELTGYSRDDVLGQPEASFRNALQPPDYYREVYALIAQHGYWSGTTWSKRKNGSLYREWRSIRALKGPDGAVSHYVFVFYEVDTGGGVAEAHPQPYKG